MAIRRVRTTIAIIALTGWSIGLLLFLGTPKGFSSTLPALQNHPPHRHNLAAAEYGPTVEVSSYYRDTFANHHPVFVVDGRRHATQLEKWASALDDTTPWVSIRWRGKHNISEVIIYHAGLVETDKFTARKYKLTCLHETGSGKELRVTENYAKVASHPFACENAQGLRIDFKPNMPGDQTRIFEIEVPGQ